MHPRTIPGIDNTFGHQLNRLLAEAEVRHTLAMRFKRLLTLNCEAILAVSDVCRNEDWAYFTMDGPPLDYHDPIGVLRRLEKESPPEEEE